MNRAFSFRLFYQVDTCNEKSMVKVEVHDGNRWLSAGELKRAAAGGCPGEVGLMLNSTYKTLVSCGLSQDAVGKTRLFGRKQTRIDGVNLPLNDLILQGWDIQGYPNKYGVKDDATRSRVYADAQKTGSHLDASNVVGDEAFRDTQGLALKGLVDGMRAAGLPVHLYVDSSTIYWLRNNGMGEAATYLSDFLDDHNPATRCITASSFGASVDPILLDWANRTGGHAISKDAFDEFDMTYDWLLNGAERGQPRIHKFVRSGDVIAIPDFGLRCEIPKAW